MKILLIEPSKADVTIGGEDFSIFEPLALEYVAAGVKDEHEVKIIDLRFGENLEEVLNQFQPQIVGITAYTVHVNVVKSLFKRIKNWNADILTVIGGHHATIKPEDFITPSIDLIVIGDGVLTFKEIANRFQHGKGFEGLAGCTYSDNGKLHQFNPAAEISLDEFPFPARELTRQYRDKYFCDWMKPLASIRTSKGCPFRCTFCAMWKVAGGKYLKRDPLKIVKELQTIKEKYVFFADDESLIDVSRMQTLAEIIKQRGIEKRYFLYGRSDTIAKNPKLIKIWKDIGLERVFVGLEFFRDEDLKDIAKKSTVSDNKVAVKILQDLGIEIYASLIVRPEYTKEDFVRLRKYVRDLKLNFAGFAVLTPLPGTDLYNKVQAKLITDNYDYYDFIHTVLPTELTLEDFYREYEQLYKKGVAKWRGLASLRKYPLKEISPLIKKSEIIYKRFASAHQDYKQLGAL